jgi:integrase
MAYGQQRDNGSWRARYTRPDGTLGSRDGFTSEKAAEDWGIGQEALIRRNLWIDPRDAETRFGVFVVEWRNAVGLRLGRGTLAKYDSVLDNHVLPQWEAWPLIGIFNSYIEIEKWVSELHQEYADSTVATIFATFSTVLKAAFKAQMIPANPCAGVRVTSGEFVTERLVASPVQVLRAAMRLYELGLGLGGFTLGLLDAYTGGRWGELAGQQRHEYDWEKRAIVVREPLKEIGGKVYKGDRPAGEPEPDGALPVPKGRPKASKKGRTKTPAGTRPIDLPPGIAVFYEQLLDSHQHPYVLCSPEGKPWRRSNFRQRYWRPAWDGHLPDDPSNKDHVPPILPWFTFHEGRHTHNTWLIEDGIPEVARRARLGHKMKGIGRIYDHVTPEMRRQILLTLEQRWQTSLTMVTPAEQASLIGWFPHLGPVIEKLRVPAARSIAQISPIAPPNAEKPVSDDR